MFDREAVNNQFQTLLNKYGINIPKDEKLTFTIEPNYFTLKVNAAKDEHLAHIIEQALNKNSENVEELFFHISLSVLEKNIQFTKEKNDKFDIIEFVKHYIGDIRSSKDGYNLVDLKVEGDKFLTPEAEDVFEIAKKNFLERHAGRTGVEISAALSHYQSKYIDLARKGFENVPDLVLSIDYENGSFYDIGQKESFGTGKTDWIEAWNIAKTNDYNTAQDKRNYQSFYNNNPYEFIQSINKYDLVNEIKDVTGFDITNLKENNGIFLTPKGDNIFELYKNKLQSKYFFSKALQEAKMKHYEKLLKDLSKIGLNNIPNFKPKKEENLIEILSKLKLLEVYA